MTLTQHPLIKTQAKGQSVAANVETAEVQSLARIQELMIYRQMLSYRMSLQNKIESLKSAIKNKQFNLSTLTPLKPKGAIFTSIGTVGLTKRQLFILVCVFGFFMGFIAVFFAEFRQWMKRQDAHK